MPTYVATLFCVLFLGTFGLFAEGSGSKLPSKDTTSPNQFSLINAEYVVAEDETNAVITISFYPGDRGWSGAVNYSTSDGTAVAGEDYTPTNGTLFVNYNSPKYFTISIHLDSMDEEDETFNVRIWWDGAIIYRSNAVVRIRNARPLPTIQIRPATNNNLSISWLDDGVSYIVEKSTTCLEPVWTPVNSSITKNGGTSSVLDPITGAVGFYRLRKQQ